MTLKDYKKYEITFESGYKFKVDAPSKTYISERISENAIALGIRSAKNYTIKEVN